MQAFGIVVAFSGIRHGCFGFGFRNLNERTGGSANGTPRNSVTNLPFSP